jgi:cysteine-rich repeat protein
MRWVGVGVFLVLAASTARAVAPTFPGATTVVLTNTEADIPIPDNGSLIGLVTAPAGGVVVDVDVAVSITHPQPDQLDISLVSPRGTTITLSTDNGGSNDDVFADTTFDDQASGTPSAPTARNFVYANLVSTGPLQPEEALAALAGEPVEGPWALVVVDDSGGQSGLLRGWSLTLTAVPGVQTALPSSFAGVGDDIPNGADGLDSTVEVAGMVGLLFDVNVVVDITHPNASDLDLSLTAPSGRRIDLVTDVGGGNDDAYVGTTFDDQAGTPIADLTLPMSGTPFAAVVGEGALGAFMGEEANGTWTLNVADDTVGNDGTLRGWTLVLTAVAVCGDGRLDPGETCDDGNGVDGDGCEANCTPTGVPCPGGCQATETNCTDCVDDDGNGLTDALDPACQAGVLTLRRAIVTQRGFKLKVTGTLPSRPAGTEPATVVLADADGTVMCQALTGSRRKVSAPVGNGRVTLTLRGRGRFVLSGRYLDLTALDKPGLLLGLRVGDLTVAGNGTLELRGLRSR